MSLSDRYLDWKNLCVNKILSNVVYSQNNMLFTAKLVIFLCSVISQGKVVALDRWGGKWNHFSMTHRLTTNYAKNYCNRKLIVKVIVENVVTCFFGDTVYVGYFCSTILGFPERDSGSSTFSRARGAATGFSFDLAKAVQWNQFWIKTETDFSFREIIEYTFCFHTTRYHMCYVNQTSFPDSWKKCV